MIDTIANSVFICIYVFAFIPALGHWLGTSTKPHWCGYDYEPCMGRGLIAHVVVAAIALVIWSIFYKLF